MKHLALIISAIGLVGCTSIKTNIGNMYYRGLLVDQSYEKANEWWHKAAEK